MPYKDTEERRAYARAHRAEHSAYMRAYRVEHPEKAHAWEFTYNEAHREERRAYARAYYKEHKEGQREERRAYNHIYATTHLAEIAEKSRRRRALQYGATIGLIDLAAIKVRDRMRCAICGKKVAEKDLSFDHSHPLSLGGPHSQENLRISHRRCNYRRGPGHLPVQMVLL